MPNVNNASVVKTLQHGQDPLNQLIVKQALTIEYLDSVIKAARRTLFFLSWMPQALQLPIRALTCSRLTIS